MSNNIVFMNDEQQIISLIAKIRDKANKLILSELKNGGITDLAPSHGAILNALFNSSGKVRMADIAAKINKDKSTVTALINKLSKLEYVQRAKCTEDSRITYITLTQKGIDLEPTFKHVSTVLQTTTMKNFRPDEKEELIEKLIKLYNNF